MKRLSVLFLILVGLSCGLFKEPDYCPIELGYRWEYDCKAPQGNFTLIVLVKDTVTLGGEYAGWLVETQTVRGSTTLYDTFYLYRAEDELRYYPDPSSTFYWKLLELPLKTGEDWTVHSDPTFGMIKAEVLYKEAVAVPYKKVNDCFKVQYTWSHGVVSLVYPCWFGPDLGLVRWEDIGEATSGELTKFER